MASASSTREAARETTSYLPYAETNRPNLLADLAEAGRLKHGRNTYPDDPVDVDYVTLARRRTHSLSYERFADREMIDFHSR